MSDFESTPAPEYDLGQWEAALTIHVGEGYVCRTCGQVVMVTHGGVGSMELVCCGRSMQKLSPAAGAGR
jgi:desulfoferrodoxin-like iron-binding protein